MARTFTSREEWRIAIRADADQITDMARRIKGNERRLLQSVVAALREIEIPDRFDRGLVRKPKGQHIIEIANLSETANVLVHAVLRDGAFEAIQRVTSNGVRLKRGVRYTIRIEVAVPPLR